MLVMALSKDCVALRSQSLQLTVGVALLGVALLGVHPSTQKLVMIQAKIIAA
jgi:hypothetical protein